MAAMQPKQGHLPSGGGGSFSGGGAKPPDSGSPVEPLLRPPAERLRYFTGTDAKNRPIPRPDLLDREADAVAQQFAAVPASQLRRFYSAVTSLKRQIELDRDYSIENIRARLALLKAHAAYTQKRSKNMPEEFIKFFVRHADAVQTKEDFLAGFVPHFEAVIAYHKVYEIKDKGRD